MNPLWIARTLSLWTLGTALGAVVNGSHVDFYGALVGLSVASAITFIRALQARS